MTPSAGSEPTKIAKRLMAYPAVPPPEAARLLAVGAERGDGEAAYLLAVLTASGYGAAQNSDLALRLLQQSVEAGFADPAELELLHRHPFWAAPIERRHVSEQPRIRVVENLAPPAVCDWLIRQADGRLQPAAVLRAEIGGRHLSAGRTNTSVFIPLPETGVVLAFFRARLSAACGAPVANFEDASLLHYAPGQSFAPHLDAVPDTPAYAKDIERLGRRAATFLVYLNSGFEAGETDFPRIGFRFKGQPGDGLYWSNYTPAGAPDPLTVHAGLPPASGEKWLLSQWIRERAPAPPKRPAPPASPTAPEPQQEP